MSLTFTQEDKQELAGIRAHYPDGRAATLPALHFAQRKFGHVSAEVIDLVAAELALSRSHVLNVATFYTMYNKKPVGKYHIQICTNISCSLLGARRLVEHLTALLGIQPGETTEDGLFTLTEVECLGSCGTAPMMQVNDTFFENLTEARLDELFQSMKKGEIDV